MRQELFLQGATGLDIEGAVDRLVRHVTVPIVWIGAPEPASDLFWGPMLLELVGDALSEVLMQGKLTGLRSTRSIPCCLVGLARSVPLTPFIPPDFTADGGRGSP